METCPVCQEKLLFGHCRFGHDQSAEPDTIDDALEYRQRSLGDVIKKAREQGVITTVSFGSA